MIAALLLVAFWYWSWKMTWPHQASAPIVGSRMSAAWTVMYCEVSEDWTPLADFCDRDERLAGTRMAAQAPRAGGRPA